MSSQLWDYSRFPALIPPLEPSPLISPASHADQVLARAFAVVGDASRLRQMTLKLVLGEGERGGSQGGKRGARKSGGERGGRPGRSADRERKSPHASSLCEISPLLPLSPSGHSDDISLIDSSISLCMFDAPKCGPFPPVRPSRQHRPHRRLHLSAHFWRPHDSRQRARGPVLACGGAQVRRGGWEAE